MSRSERIAGQLGMSIGAASHRLRKNILFSLLKKVHEDVCFVCGQKIETVEELSIEHKLPWEGRSAELFWDLNNIAFSHLKCNRQHEHNSGGENKKIGPPGTNWCFRHKQFLPTDNFVVNKTRFSGFHNLCKECQHYNRE
jgi:hypothetical protein